MAALRTGLRERWQAQRDRLLTSPGFGDAAARFVATRPFARARAHALFDLVAGFVYSQWLAACVELRLFERLARAPLTAEQIAMQDRLPLASAERLLEAAASLGLTERREPDAAGRVRHGLGPLGAAMVANPAVAAMVEHHRALYAELADPLALLRRGEGGLARYWAYASSDAPAGLQDGTTAPYSALMSVTQPLVAAQVLDAVPLGRHRLLMDVGGGEGAFAAAALERHPTLRAMVYDLPAVAAAANVRFARLGLSHRAHALGGDFHRDALPQGADVISLVRVAYDHPDERVLALLRAARRALPPGGTLLLAEPMAATAGAEAMGAAYFGMYLLAMGSGRPRSAAELTALLHRAGFSKVRRRRTALPLLAGVLVARAEGGIPDDGTGREPQNVNPA